MLLFMTEQQQKSRKALSGDQIVFLQELVGSFTSETSSVLLLLTAA